MVLETGDAAMAVLVAVITGEIITYVLARAAAPPTSIALGGGAAGVVAGAIYIAMATK